MMYYLLSVIKKEKKRGYLLTMRADTEQAMNQVQTCNSLFTMIIDMPSTIKSYIQIMNVFCECFFKCSDTSYKTVFVTLCGVI